MLRLDDPRWTTLRGGYRVSYDPRGALAALEQGSEVNSAWQELWNELHHQGDVGEASYAAIPHLVRIHRKRGVLDPNTYALTATIEDVRRNPGNPAIPSWLLDDYDSALHQLVELGLNDFRHAKEPELVSGILAILAMTKGQLLLSRFAVSYTDDERRKILESVGRN
jgi:hypothetical protein